MADPVVLDGSVLRVGAPLTMRRTQGVADSGQRLLKGGDVVVDLSRVPEADSSALALLLAWQRRQRQQGGTLRVEHVPEGLQSIARVYGMEGEIDGLVPPAAGA